MIAWRAQRVVGFIPGDGMGQARMRSSPPIIVRGSFVLGPAIGT